jgi:undecaprenyl phosphate N,N'-diacetylbacillosamine 1-phosphate transferase
MYRNYIKRILDILISIIALPIFVLFYIIIGLFIKLEDKGPILYVADRIGKDGKIFRMYKFRSMKVNAPVILNADGSTYNAKDDERVTRIGRL